MYCVYISCIPLDTSETDPMDVESKMEDGGVGGRENVNMYIKCSFFFCFSTASDKTSWKLSWEIIVTSNLRWRMAGGSRENVSVPITCTFLLVLDRL